jgi:hypothetical protein
VRFIRALLATAMVLPLLAGPSAHAVTYDCEVSGRGGEFQVRKLVVSEPWLIGLSGSVTLDGPDVVTTERKHIFGGIWVIDANLRASISHSFLDHGSSFDPPTLRATFQGDGVLDVSGASTDLVVDGHGQGHWHVAPYIPKGTFYVVGFGTGTGRWKFDLHLADGDRDTTDPCPIIATDGSTIDLGVADFKGGDQVIAPGFGAVTGATAKLTIPNGFTLGGAFAYEPSPFPAAQMSFSNSDDSEKYVVNNTIVGFAGPTAHSQLTTQVAYIGDTTTIGLDLLSVDIPF